MLQGEVLYPLYISDIPTLDYSNVATLAVDTFILAVGRTHETAATNLQNSNDQINIKLNHKSFTSNKEKHLLIRLKNNAQISYPNTPKYL